MKKEYPDSLVTGIALTGLSGPIRQTVMPQNHKTLEELRSAAILAEKTVLSTTASEASVNVEDITKRVLDAETDKLADVIAFGRESADPPRYHRDHPRGQPPQTWSRQRQQPGRFNNRSQPTLQLHPMTLNVEDMKNIHIKSEPLFCLVSLHTSS